MFNFAKSREFAQAFKNAQKKESCKFKFFNYRGKVVEVTTAKQFIELAKKETPADNGELCCLIVSYPNGYDPSIRFVKQKNKVVETNHTPSPYVERTFAKFLKDICFDEKYFETALM